MPGRDSGNADIPQGPPRGGLLGGARLRWVTGAAAVAAAGALALVLATRDDEPAPVVPVPTAPAASATTMPSLVASATATQVVPTAVQTPTTVVQVPTVVAGKPVTVLARADSVPFPAGIVGYFGFSGCFNCGFGTGGIWRIYRGRDGQLVVDHTEPEGYVDGYAIARDGSLLVASVCSSYCGGEGFPHDDAVAQFYYSRDGGITWQASDGPVLPRTTVWFSGWLGGEVVVNAIHYPPSNVPDRVDAYLLPSFTRLEPPAGLGGARPGLPGPFASVGPDGNLYWSGLGSVSDSGLYDAAGRPAVFAGLDVVFPGARWTSRTYGEASPGTISDVWLTFPSDRPRFFVEVDAAGSPVGAYSAGTENVTFAGRISATTWMGTGEFPLEDGEPPGASENPRVVLIDVATGLLHPIFELRSDRIPIPAPEGRGYRKYAWPRAVLVGSFWRVETGGDCLNVRASPSSGSTSFGCFRDGVLLSERAADAPEGWLAVTTPGGVPGFAASEYLR